LFTAINFYSYETVSGLLNWQEDLLATSQRLLAGAIAVVMSTMACYLLDLVQTWLMTQLEGKEVYVG
jgi:hypothetical protein